MTKSKHRKYLQSQKKVVDESNITAEQLKKDMEIKDIILGCR